jgi:hypothetical protein
MPKSSAFENLFDGRQDTMPPRHDRNEKRATPAPVGRPEAGKRSNPDYKQFSVLLKKQTHMDASHTLDRAGRQMDVSDLVQHLLEQWLKQQEKKAK